GTEKLTDTGLAVGTPGYMSPEQATAEAHIDGRADTYALGCVLYEMLAGHPPFLGTTAQEVLARHTLDPVPPLRTIRRAVPPAVEHAVFKALAKSPADRFPSAAAFSEALTQTGAPPSLTRQAARPASASRERRSTSGRSGTSSTSATCWREASAGRDRDCASALSSSTQRPATISGRTNTTAMRETCSPSRTKSPGPS